MSPGFPYAEATARIAWNAISFFSLPADEQRANLGEAEAWFMPINADGDAQSNYLFGCALVYLSYWMSWNDEAPRGHEELKQLAEELRSILSDRASIEWKSESLAKSAKWQAVRSTAGTILSKNGLPIDLQLVPFDLASLIEVDGYLDSSVARNN